MDLNCSAFLGVNFLGQSGTVIKLIQEAIGEQMYKRLNLKLCEESSRLFDHKIYFIQMNKAVGILNSRFHRDHL